MISGVSIRNLLLTTITIDHSFQDAWPYSVELFLYYNPGTCSSCSTGGLWKGTLKWIQAPPLPLGRWTTLLSAPHLNVTIRKCHLTCKLGSRQLSSLEHSSSSGPNSVSKSYLRAVILPSSRKRHHRNQLPVLCSVLLRLLIHQLQLQLLLVQLLIRPAIGIGISISGSRNIVIMSKSTSYKQQKEDFVSGLTGGSVAEINYVTAVAPVRSVFRHPTPRFLMIMETNATRRLIDRGSSLVRSASSSVILQALLCCRDPRRLPPERRTLSSCDNTIRAPTSSPRSPPRRSRHSHLHSSSQ